MERITTEICRKIWNDDEGVCICVSPDGDSLMMVRIHTPDEKSRDWFGSFDFNLTPEVAIHVAEAMIAAAQEAKRADN